LGTGARHKARVKLFHLWDPRQSATPPHPAEPVTTTHLGGLARSDAMFVECLTQANPWKPRNPLVKRKAPPRLWVACTCGPKGLISPSSVTPETKLSAREP
ncbi:mCG145202, partial [Mus musculus]